MINGELVTSEEEGGKECVVFRMAVIFLYEVLSGKTKTVCEYELIGMKKYAQWPISTNSR